ncbi:hypothetical protein E6C27_scaffold93G00010 [Cucumis melo var. makuwa]|uniref:Uncharacterized protein n=1 Tax=Cucumis melo var. makuwa TaxID=1194695 RepID=A0A5A7THK8_CUCMM|nr:hypothetical protein E6C27_scaffold93G00010 [Cucumis melo var. makuwa]
MLSLFITCPSDPRPFLPLVEQAVESSTSDRVRCEPSLHFLPKVTLEFRSFTAGAVEANSPLLGWIRLDAVLNENLATFQDTRYELCHGGTKGLEISWVDCVYAVERCCMVSFGIPRLIYVSFGITRLICASFGITRLISVSFGITRLICASFEITRLICVSFGITKLICASFGITRLMCAFYETTRLFMYDKGMVRGRPAKGKKDA